MMSIVEDGRSTSNAQPTVPDAQTTPSGIVDQLASGSATNPIAVSPATSFASIRKKYKGSAAATAKAVESARISSRSAKVSSRSATATEEDVAAREAAAMEAAAKEAAVKKAAAQRLRESCEKAAEKRRIEAAAASEMAASGGIVPATVSAVSAIPASPASSVAPDYEENDEEPMEQPATTEQLQAMIEGEIGILAIQPPAHPEDDDDESDL